MHLEEKGFGEMKIGDYRQLRKEIGKPISRNGKICAFELGKYRITAEEKDKNELYCILTIYDKELQREVKEIKE